MADAYKLIFKVLFYGWAVLCSILLVSGIFNLRRSARIFGKFVAQVYTPIYLIGFIIALLLWAWER